MSQTDSGIARLTKATLVPLGVVVGMVASALFGQSWLDDKFDSAKTHIDTKFEEQTDRMIKVEQRLFELEQAQAIRWNSLDMRSWILDLKAANPAMQIPDVREQRHGDSK